MFRRVEKSDHQAPTDVFGTTGRHRGRSPMPAVLTLGLTVLGLLTAFGVGAAVLPDSVTGSGATAEKPPAYVSVPTGDDGGVAEPAPTSDTDPSNLAVESAAPKKPKAKPAASKAPVSKPKTTKAKAKAKAPAAPVGKDQVSQENEVIRLTNVERAKNGCGKVTLNTKLRAAMRAHTRDMAANNYFSHDSQDGRSPWDRAKSAGYQTPIGENIAKGQSNAAAVMRSWMNSSGHKANILNCKAKAIGVGLSYDGGSPIWGQLFGSV